MEPMYMALYIAPLYRVLICEGSKYIAPYTVKMSIAAILYLAAARHEYCAPAKLKILHSYIWRRHAFDFPSVPSSEFRNLLFSSEGFW